ncbi:unnamed protein product [Didymodactylos carnosus]|uniref:Uncharacterized protein n=1 Tax=Didymodactylos carnosus TaxID=1234261 RepID=A0A8S2D649_9BILA|nr:unnamed protein product [Didymodactylos carnosus]CAF3638099.1 unnamed protein product [Didymodactylos carnosus]
MSRSRFRHGLVKNPSGPGQLCFGEIITDQLNRCDLTTNSKSVQTDVTLEHFDAIHDADTSNVDENDEELDLEAFHLNHIITMFMISQ